MKNQTQLVTAITNRDVDFAAWYTDVVKKAELIDYSATKGFPILRPYAYAIWEHITALTDALFKQTGHENVSMPLLIPESLLQKEKDHVAGFAPEVAWVTHGGSEPLQERLCIRPTSETLFCEHYAHIIQSWRDLPKLYNQWCSVVRWEKSTRPFLRGREFHWQEGHTIHATEQEAREETLRMLDVYTKVAEEYLAMPVLRGRKTESEKFAGALETYSIECMMHDGKALQSGTTHYFGDGFARSFEIQYTDKQNKLQYPHQTSWGISTRLIGGIIMTHGDDSGLVLPPMVAPVQVVVIPVAMHKPGVLEKAADIAAALRAGGIRVKLDDSDQSPGWKFAEYEMKGVPLRLELGPRDIEARQCVVARRTGGKETFPIEGITATVQTLLKEVQQTLFDNAKAALDSRIREAHTLDEMVETYHTHGGFLKTMWCGDAACEETVKAATEGVKSRCMPFDQTPIGDTCAVCGKPADKVLYWGNQY